MASNRFLPPKCLVILNALRPYELMVDKSRREGKRVGSVVRGSGIYDADYIYLIEK